MAAIVAAAKPEVNAPVLKFSGHTQVCTTLCACLQRRNVSRSLHLCILIA